MNLITVIIPVYNLEEYLKECLDSVIEHTHINFEIILVNDGSTDGSREICEYYADAYNYIILINQKNGGLSAARNTGIHAASGDYILFLDADDLLEDGILNYLEEFLYLKKMPDAVIFNYTKFYQKKNEYEKTTKEIEPDIVNKKAKEDLVQYLLSTDQQFQWMVWQLIYKKEILLNNNLFFEIGRLYEDVLWLPGVMLHLNRVEYFTQSVYVYRLERDGQITSTISKKSLLDNIYIPKYWNARLDELQIKDSLKESLMKSFSIRYFYSIWFLNFLDLEDREIVLKNLIKEKKYLDYSKTTVTKLTKAMVKIIGFSLTSKIFKTAILFKQKFS